MQNYSAYSCSILFKKIFIRPLGDDDDAYQENKFKKSKEIPILNEHENVIKLQWGYFSLKHV